MKLTVDFSVVVPAHNEEDDVQPLVREIVAAAESCGLDFEIIFVDDCSTDATLQRLRDAMTLVPQLRVLHLSQDSRDGCPSEPRQEWSGLDVRAHKPLVSTRGSDKTTINRKSFGQSAAFKAGLAAARGDAIAMLDADGQNDPADIPRMLELMRAHDVDMVQGDRSADRHDTALRRTSSALARVMRRVILSDTTRDSGCSLRVMRKEVVEALPLEYRGMHRFIPAAARRCGFRVIETKVNHRPRTNGRTKYGVFDRALPSLIDCFMLRWALRRRVRCAPYEVQRSKRTILNGSAESPACGSQLQASRTL